jgi:hypothetical protein
MIDTDSLTVATERLARLQAQLTATVQPLLVQ